MMKIKQYRRMRSWKVTGKNSKWKRENQISKRVLRRHRVLPFSILFINKTT